jgi:hypothetical protein
MEKVIILGFKPIEQYFRKWMFPFAEKYDLEMVYIHLANKKIFLSKYENKQFVTTDISIKELGQYKNADLMVFNFGLGSFLKFYMLKFFLNPKKLYWDYIDNLYYGNESLRNFFYHKIYERVSDGVLVLNRLLSYRFHNPIEFGNASHLEKFNNVINNKNNIITISSIDSRFDFEFYESLLKTFPEKKFMLYGWIKNQNMQIVKIIEHWKTYSNFEYFGSYDNDQLESILCNAQIGLIPYKVSEMTLYINPDKYYHYSNFGLKIISSYIPILSDKNNVNFYRNIDDIKNILNKDFQDDYVHSSWEENVKILKGLL